METCFEQNLNDEKRDFEQKVSQKNQKAFLSKISGPNLNWILYTLRFFSHNWKTFHHSCTKIILSFTSNRGLGADQRENKESEPFLCLVELQKQGAFY